MSLFERIQELEKRVAQLRNQRNALRRSRDMWKLRSQHAERALHDAFSGTARRRRKAAA